MTNTPLILIPGLLCDHTLWAAQLPALSDGSDIIVTDQHINHESLDSAASTILQKAPPRFDLAGFSMGGYIALEIMRQAPERVGRLALLDTSARADTEAQTKRRRDLITLAKQGRFKGVTPQLLPLLVHASRLTDQLLIDRIMAMAQHVGRDGFLRQQTAIIARPDSRPYLAAIRCPTLILCGDNDRVTPPELSAEMATAIPQAKLVTIASSGHMAPMERPDPVTTALLDWRKIPN